MKSSDNFDSLDRKIIRSLSEDGRMPVKDLIKKLEITSPTLNMRIKQLVKSGILKIAGMVDVFKAEGLIMALVAIGVCDESKLDETLKGLTELEDVSAAYVVTGRYDIFAEVVFSGGMEELYLFMSQKLPRLKNIQSSESFVVMKAKKKWLLLPPKLQNYWD